ncbi:MAG: hypothetical protein ACXWBP_06785 [Limisphaerales bacterium]
MDIDEALQDVQTIKTVAAGLPRNRDSIYVLLTVIYRIGRKWRKSRVSAALRDAVAAHDGIKVDRRAKGNVFRFLIEITYRVDIKLRSRYTNALRYAWVCNCSPTELTDFIKRNGKIEKCANKYIAHKRKSASSE